MNWEVAGKTFFGVIWAVGTWSMLAATCAAIAEDRWKEAIVCGLITLVSVSLIMGVVFA